MASSEVAICNLALSHVGASSIQSLEDKSKEARACKQLYEQSRDTVLAAHDWAFARRRVALAQLGEAHLGWDVAYQFPTECLKDREIYNGVSYPAHPGAKVPYEVATNEAMDTKVILTNEDTATLVFTAKVVNVTVFDPIMINALAWLIATDLAVPLKGKLDLQQANLQRYANTIGVAQSRDANQGYVAPTTDNSFTGARL